MHKAHQSRKLMSNFELSVINVDVGMLTKFSTSGNIERLINDYKVH